ncbi:MAG: SIS domain-containing protein [Erysipelotrichaceae bacterium]|nr:SIS domain-containing protein [Erysipelotrichaceae bacterium]MBQ7889971.1 SIS domain-containing protein [Erysipelotrichaceae bacterium]
MYEFEYMSKLSDLLQKAHDVNKDTIKHLARVFADTIKNDKMIHVFGTGHSHMIGIELFARAGGLGNVNALLDPDSLTAFGAQRSGAMEKLPGVADIIYDSYKIEKGDIMIISSNSGRNAIPIEMAMRCQKEGVYVIALTNLEQSKNTTSRHPSGKRLFECADCILDNCVPSGDALMNIHGILTGPGSSIASMALLDTIVCEALEICAQEGIKAYVFQSQNVDGFDNDAIYNKFDGRVKHF